MSSLGQFVVSIQDYLQNNGAAFVQDSVLTYLAMQINFWVNLLLMPVVGVVYFLILQAVSQGLLMLIDLNENKRK
ncbi:MAG: hypothetical protein IT310_12405 [Anaerolineales bacterium]|nr:hypothetical protein [Anaerolineales bacterium]